jgi:sulfate adenylyltransferase
MADLIPPHGGLTEPINRTVPAVEAAGFLRSNTFHGRSADDLPRVVVSAGDLSTLYRIADGGLSPLTGPMTRDEYDRVLDEEVVVRGGKKYAWTIPVAFPVTDEEASTLAAGDYATLVNEKGQAVGVLEVKDVFPWDKSKYNQVVYQTDRTDHPGARIALADPRTRLVGGEVQALPQPKHPEYGHLVLTPRETRRLFKDKGYERVVAFQTRNALHRAHEYALVVGLERLTREGHFAGAVLNPLIGETKSDDVDALTRMRTYRALIDNKVLGQGDTDEDLWKKVGRSFSDTVLLLGLDIKMFYGGPKEAIMHGIYRQNFGFTDIIIGRKHADAPYDDGKDIWDGLAAQRKFDELKGELLIKPVKVGFAAFFEELGHVGLVDEYGPKGYHPVSISGRDLREQLRAGQLPDPRIMRPETAKVLIEKMRQG